MIESAVYARGDGTENGMISCFTCTGMQSDCNEHGGLRDDASEWATLINN